MSRHTLTVIAIAISSTAISSTRVLAQIQGPSTGSTPYVLPTVAGVQTRSILTVDNTGANADDTVAKVGGGLYQLNGIPDGLGALQGANPNEIVVLVNQELGSTLGVTRAHGAAGAYVSKFTINKNNLSVINGEDLIKSAFNWNSTTQTSNTATSTLAFNRFCSADLAAPSAYFNPASGLGTSARIFMHGEEGGANGWQQGTVVTGADAGKSYVLGKFNLSTNGSGLTGVGGWENALANPMAQDKTVVIGTNDGGTGIMSNALAVYVGTKTNTGSEVDKAGLTNGALSFINVAGNTTEIANTTTRATNITNGTRFSLSGTASTTFSRPEDGAWNPANPNEFYFATTDRLDQVSDGTGTQIGATRLWRLTFDDITNPTAGGKVDLMLDGATASNTTKKTNMFDNMTVAPDGMIFLQEDVGNTAHNGKVLQFDPSTGVLTEILKHDTARFGDIGLAATSPFSQDEESSGIIDITELMAGSPLNTGYVGERWLLSTDQAHYSTGITAEQVEGGQLFAVHILPEPTTLTALAGLATIALRRRGR